MQSLLAPGTLLGLACRGTGPSGYSQEDREGPPALLCPAPHSQLSWCAGSWGHPLHRAGQARGMKKRA